MASFKLLNLLALASVAIVALSNGPVRVNALVADRAQVARHVHAHDAMARRKRDDSASPSSASHCKPRPSSSTPAPSTPAASTPAASTPASFAPASSTSTSSTSTSSTPAPTSTPATPSSTSSTAPSPSTTSSSSSGKKWGLAWGGDDRNLQEWGLSKVGYMYNWSPDSPSSPLPNGVEFIPQLWGWKSVSDFQSKVVAGYAHKVLGQNEPNEPSQSNMSPQDGFNMWMQYINPLKDQGYYLISPACTDDSAGMDWYNQFFSYCNQNSACHVDAIAFHAYTANAQDLINYATNLHNTFNKPIWITEFADQNFSGSGGEPSMNQVWDFAGQVTAFINNNDWIEAAFPFGAMLDLQGVDTANSLMNSDGSPNSLAYYYLN